MSANDTKINPVDGFPKLPLDIGPNGTKHSASTKAIPTPTKVAILGGGVAGLSAAHELAKYRNFEVHVFEKGDDVGGKARSQDVGKHLGATKNKPLLLGEHGFRLFPHFYRHITQTLKEIPYSSDLGRLPALDGNVWGNLRGSTEGGYAAGELHTVQRPFPPTTVDLVRAVRELLGNDSPATETDVIIYAWHILKFLTACQERRDEEYDLVTWAEFVGVGRGFYSSAFERFIRAAPRNLSAMWPDKCSARSCGGTLVQMLVDFTGEAGLNMDAVLTGPTTETWLKPWRAYLEGRLRKDGEEDPSGGTRAVDIQTGWEVVGFDFDRGSLQRVFLKDRSGEPRQLVAKRAKPVDRIRCDPSDGEFDYFICALPLEVIQAVLDEKQITERNPAIKSTIVEACAAGARKMRQFDASIDQLTKIEEGTALMVGLQFYLKQDAPICHGHVLYPDSPWALTSVSQAQFWEKQLATQSLETYLRQEFEVHGVRGVLSVIISDWTTPSPRLRRPAMDCTKEELKREVWMQLTEALARGNVVLTDEHLWVSPAAKKKLTGKRLTRERRLDLMLESAGHVDDNLQCAPRDVTFHDRETGEPTTKPQQQVPQEGNLDSTPLFVHPRGSQQLRPDAQLRIPNLLLASDYVRTFTDLATMEAANEAARRAVLAILRRETVASPEVYPKLWPLLEGTWFEAAKALDRMLFLAGQAHVMEAPQMLSTVFGATFDGALSTALSLLGNRSRPPAELARRILAVASARPPGTARVTGREGTGTSTFLEALTNFIAG